MTRPVYAWAKIPVEILDSLGHRKRGRSEEPDIVDREQPSRGRTGQPSFSRSEDARTP